MAKIKIDDLPHDLEIDQELTKKIKGGLGSIQAQQYPIKFSKLKTSSSQDLELGSLLNRG